MYNILKEYRVKDWFHYLGYILLGSLASRNLNFINFLLGFFMLSYAYSFNDFFDKKLKNKLFILPLLLSLIFLPFLSKLQLIFYFSFILIFTLYSWPVTYLEGRPLLSTISNSIGFLLIFFLPFINIEKLLQFLDFSLLLFLLNTVAQIIHEIVDYKEDKKNEKITTAVSFGHKNSISLLRLVLIVVFLLSLFLFSRFKFISLSTFLFTTYFLFLSYRKVDSKFRKWFKCLGIVCGVTYLLELVHV